MPTGGSDFRHGRIVAARLAGRNGRRELHPAVIVSPDAEIVQPENFDPRASSGGVAANLVAALGVSTKYRDFSDPHLPLPVGTATRLTKDCAVILNWYAILDIPDDCDYLLGDVPPALMRRINEALRHDLKARLGEMQGTLSELLGLLDRPD